MIGFVMRSLVAVTLAVAVAVAAGAGPSRAQENRLTVFAAASLKNALDGVNKAWQAAGHPPAVISYAASSALAKQIEAAAPADIFVSADLDWMDYLQERKLVRTDTRVTLLGNRLVLVAPNDSTLDAKIEPGFPLASMLADGRLSMANTDSVPAGKYGKAALMALKVWDQVSGRIAQAENVRAALLLVSRGEAPLGIVYETDAKADPNVKILGRFPEDSHPPIVYPAAVLEASASKAAVGFLDFLKSSDAKSVFQAQGFTVLNCGTDGQRCPQG